MLLGGLVHFLRLFSLCHHLSGLFLVNLRSTLLEVTHKVCPPVLIILPHRTLMIILVMMHPCQLVHISMHNSIHMPVHMPCILPLISALGPIHMYACVYTQAIGPPTESPRLPLSPFMTAKDSQLESEHALCTTCKDAHPHADDCTHW